MILPSVKGNIIKHLTICKGTPRKLSRIVSQTSAFRCELCSLKVHQRCRSQTKKHGSFIFFLEKTRIPTHLGGCPKGKRPVRSMVEYPRRSNCLQCVRVHRFWLLHLEGWMIFWSAFGRERYVDILDVFLIFFNVRFFFGGDDNRFFFWGGGRMIIVFVFWITEST